MPKLHRHSGPKPSSSDTASPLPASRLQVLVADRQEITLAGTCAILTEANRIQIAGQSTTLAGAMAVLGRHAVDLAILELRFSDGSGIDACRTIRSSFPNTHVAILTGEIDEESIILALQAGAAGILLKRISGTRLLHAIEALCDGYMILDSGVSQRILPHLCNLSLQAYGKSRMELSDQEKRVMTLVAEGKTNKEIAVFLNISDKTVKNYLNHVYEKLHVTRRAEATRLFIERTRANPIPGLADFSCPLIPLVPSNQA